MISPNPKFGAVSALLFFATSPLIAQTVGGGFETLYQWDGAYKSGLFGYATDHAGDVNNDGFSDLIIGGYRNSPGGITDAGSAFVYSGADGSLIHQWDGTAILDTLGNSVSGAGDINQDGFDDVIVGAYFASPGGRAQAGMAFVYSGLDGSTLFSWEGANPNDRLGVDVSGAGDVNADGYPDVLIGLGWSSPGGVLYAGAATVYSGKDGSILHHWTGGTGSDYFGFALSDAGDVNADGYDDVAISATGDDPPGLAFAGSTYVFSGKDGSQLYKWQGIASGDYFGSAVSGAGDVNADGFDDVVVGAKFSSPGGLAFAGSAFVFSGQDGTQLYEWNGQASDELGYSVSEAGDVNQDGYADVIVGAPEANHVGTGNTGAAMVYSGFDGSVIQRWVGGGAHDKYGGNVSGTGDVNQNGYADVVVSAWGTDPNGITAAGSVYAYGFNPFITTSSNELSVSIGGQVDIQLDFPDDASGYEFKLLASASGTGPTLYGVEIPLSNDNLVQRTFAGDYPGIGGSNPQGILDSIGQATGFLSIGAGNWSSLVGNTYYLAAIASPPGGLPEFSSVAVTLTIIP